MADTEKVILVKILTTADKAQSEIKALRSDVEGLKQDFSTLQATTGESFKVIESQIRKGISDSIEKARAEVNALNREISQLQGSLGQTGEVGVISGVDPEVLGPLQNDLVEAQEHLASMIQLQQASTVAFAEMREEARQISPPLRTAGEEAVIFRKNVDDAKMQLFEMVQAGTSVEDAVAGLRRAGEFDSTEITRARREFEQFLDFGPRIRQVGDEVENLESKTTSLGKTFDRVFRIALGIIVSQVIRGFIQQIREAIDASIEFRQSIVDLEVGVLALQRSGVETTMEEWKTVSEEMAATFTQFAQADINDAIAQILRLGRQSKLSTDQMRELLDMSAKLATFTGQTLAQSVNAVATAVESGYARGLKELIGVIDETTLAQQAVQWGMAETEEQVDGAMRATVALMLAEEEAARVGDEWARRQEDLSGQFVENKQDILDLKASIGDQLLPVVIGFQDALIWLMKKFSEAITAGQQWLLIVLSAFFAAVQTMMDITVTNIQATKKFLVDTFKEPWNIFKNFKEGWDEITSMELDTMAVENYAEAFRSLALVIDPDLFKETATAVEILDSEVEDSTDTWEEYADVIEDAADAMRDTLLDYYSDVAKENRKYQQQLIEDQMKFQLEMQQLQQQYAADVESVYRDYNNEIAEIEADYHEESLQLEEEYQEEMRQLREDYLMNLEDALRERDAKRILQLQRQYNLEKEQMTREYELDQEQLDRQYELELEEAERRKQARLAELEAEFEMRQQMMLQEFQLEQQLRQMDHEQRLQELEIAAQERLAMIAWELGEELGLTEEQMALLAQMFMDVLGQGGSVEGAFEYAVSVAALSAQTIAEYIALIMAYLEQLNAVASAVSSAYGGGGGSSSAEGENNPYMYQEGGTHVFREPTWVLAGESGPEIGTFTPLSRPGSNVNTVYGSTLPTGLGGKGGQAEIRVMLSEGLQSELTKNTLDEFAQVIIDVERSIV